MGLRIDVSDAQAWAEQTKLPIDALFDNLEGQIETRILARLEAGFDVSTWVSPSTTPAIVKTIFAMYYVAAIYDRNFSEDRDDNTDPYAAQLRIDAGDLVEGILDGSVVIDGLLVASNHADPVGFPTDGSSTPNIYQGVRYGSHREFGDASAQPPMFSVGMRF